MRLLGLDVGERRIGLAISDPLGTIASPLRVLDRKETTDPIGEIIAEAQALEVETIVVGMPLTLRGEIGPAAELMQEFVEKLRARSPIPVEIIDERLTTKVAERDMIRAGMSREGRRETIDKVAAALILQSYLDGAEQQTTPTRRMIDEEQAQ